MANRILYLDVDGVLLGKSRSEDVKIVLAKYAQEFLDYSLQNYQCFWLTTHCHDGKIDHVIELMKRYADENIIKMVKDIRPVFWKTLKTEAIDPNSDFYWIDDQLLWSEMEWLKENHALDKWIQVDTRRNPYDLKRAIYVLEEKSTAQGQKHPDEGLHLSK